MKIFLCSFLEMLDARCFQREMAMSIFKFIHMSLFLTSLIILLEDFVSVSPQILDKVSPNFSVFVKSFLLHISNSQSSPLKCLTNSIKQPLPGPSHRSLVLWFPFKVSPCQPLVVHPLDMYIPRQLALFNLARKGLIERTDLICSFLSLSILVTTLMVLRTFISAAGSLEDVILVCEQHSAP